MFRTLRQSAAILVTTVVTLGIVAFDATAQGRFLLHFTDVVEANDAVGWTHYVRAGYHRLEVEGDGDTDLDCWVFGRAGNLMGSDTDGTDYCIVTWYQSRGEQLEFRIANLGNVYNRYVFRLR
ncbi:MAG: hypothetical protein ACRD15_08725 [Vicinamibacterales bacterium]